MIETIKRDISTITSELTLSHHILLGRKSTNGQRMSEIYKKEFNSSKYKNISKLETLNILGGDYFVLSGKKKYVDTDGKTKYMTEDVYISYPHLNSLNNFLRILRSWLEEEEYSDLFVTHEGSLIVNDKYSYLVVKLEGLSSDKYLKANPISLLENDEYYEAIKIDMNGKMDITMTFNELELLMYLLDKIDLYSSSLLLMNIKTNLEAGVRASSDRAKKMEESKNKIAEISNKRKRKKVLEEAPTEDLV